MSFVRDLTVWRLYIWTPEHALLKVDSSTVTFSRHTPDFLRVSGRRALQLVDVETISVSGSLRTDATNQFLLNVTLSLPLMLLVPIRYDKSRKFWRREKFVRCIMFMFNISD